MNTRCNFQIPKSQLLRGIKPVAHSVIKEAKLSLYDSRLTAFFFFFFAFQLLPEHRPPTSPLRPILCLALRFAPAQFHASQLPLNCPLPCVLWSSYVSTTLRDPSQSFFRYTAASFPQLSFPTHSILSRN